MGSLISSVWGAAPPVIIIVFIAAVLFAAKLLRGAAKPETPPYVGKKPLTVPEQALYARLREAMPECVVLAQVALSSLIDTREVGRVKPWFNRISQKSVDFVLCLPHDFTVVAVIEVDDRTHLRADRRKADETKDLALRTAGHSLLRFKAHAVPTVEQIRAAIAGDRGREARA